MQCPKCKSTDNRIPNTRNLDDRVLRQRKCKSCGINFRTIEITCKEFNNLGAMLFNAGEDMMSAVNLPWDGRGMKRTKDDMDLLTEDVDDFDEEDQEDEFTSNNAYA